MKTINRIMLVTLMLVVFAGMVLAQTNIVVPVLGGTTVALPTTLTQFWVLAIAGVTPLITGGIYKWVPKIPKLLVPASTPVIGILLGLLINWLGKHNFAWVDLAQAGGLAVLVREIWTNAVRILASRAPSVPTTLG